MTNMILLAHGKLASEMKNSAEMICGKLSNYYPIEFLIGEGLETVIHKIADTMDSIEGNSTLIMTDIFAGTPFNAGCSYILSHKDKDIEVISGMSLPLVIEAATMCEESDASTIVDHLLEISCDTVRKFDAAQIDNEEEL